MRLSIFTVAFGILMALGLAAQAQQPSPDGPDQKQPPNAPKARGGYRGDARPEPRAEGREGDDSQPRPGGSARSGGRGKQDGPDKVGPEGGPRGFEKMPGGGGRGGGFGGGFGGPMPEGAMPGGGMRGGGGYGGGGYGGGGYGGARGGYGEYPRNFPPGGMPGYVPGGEGPPDDPEMRELMKQDADLDRQTHELAARARDARGDDRSKIKSQLTELANKHFEIRQKRRELQLKRMEEELSRLREAIAKRNASRDTIVENHLRELVGEPRDLDF